MPMCRVCGRHTLGWLPVLLSPKWLLIQTSWWLAAVAGVAWRHREVGGDPGRWWWLLLFPPAALAASFFLAVAGGAALEALEDVLLRRCRCPGCGSPLR